MARYWRMAEPSAHPVQLPGRWPSQRAVSRRASCGLVRRTARLTAVSLLALSLAFLAHAPAGAGEDKYRLGPEDRISLKVLEWRATQDQIFEWVPMTGEIAINPEGMLDVPLVGAIGAAGLTVSDLGRRIGESLQDLMGLAEAPRVAVEIIAFRPFYAAGEVAKPGPYPYRPKLTVLQAVAIAGGVARPVDVGLLRLGREVISGKGDLTLLGHELDALRARLGRLQSELDGHADIAFPAELTRRGEDGVVSLLMHQERQIFIGRRDAMKAQIEALIQLKSFLEKEAETLKAQVAGQDKQMVLVNRELQAISSLVEKGYAVSSRQLGLERVIAQIQGDKLRLETELLRVLQESSKADISMLDLRNTRTNELTAELRATQAKIDENLEKAKTAQHLLYESAISAPQRFVERDRARRNLEAKYVIVRANGAEINEIDATESTRVEPGDTLKVSLPIPDGPEDPLLRSDAAPVAAAGVTP
ncbi:MAG TPA: polysaccharide biosynthesis/export family protein [Ancylobacter sp.]